MRNRNFAYANTKAQISCAVTDQRLCFRYIDGAIPLLQNPKLQASSDLLRLHSPVCV